MRTSGQTTLDAPQNQAHASDRLDSWKQIAAYFDRDVRTVRRWESERNLPVHRLPGERGGVFAYEKELEEWRHRSSTALNAVQSVAVEAPSVAEEKPEASPVTESTDRPRRWFSIPPLIALACAATLLLAVAGGSLYAHRHPTPGATHSAARHVPLPQAQDLDLQGRYFWNQRTEPDLTHALDLFHQAIAHDPAYAPPYAGLADTYILLRQFGHMPDSEAFPRALTAANQALALDSSLAAGHRAKAFVLNYWSWDFAQANSEFRRAIELDPRDAQTHHWFATSLWSQGRAAEAREQIDQARALDPVSPATISNRALFYEGADPQAAIEVWRELARTTPNYAPAHEQLGFHDLLAHDYGGFLTEWEMVAQLRDDPYQTAVLKTARRVLERSGPEAMQRQLAKDFAELADQGHESPFTAAHFFMLIGDRAGALHELELAYQRHDPSVLIANTDSAFTPLRTTKEFAELVARWAPATKTS